MSIKQDRMQERIRSILSELFLREVSDPDLQGVTVTDVALDSELTFAKVYVNALGDEERREDVMRALDRARGYLRREVGRRIRLRNTPELHFRWDVSLAYGDRIERLLSSLDIPPEDKAQDDE